MRTAAAALAALSLTASAGGEPMRRLPGSLPRALAHMEPAGRAPADLRLEYVTIFLGLRDRRGLEGVVAAQQARRSPRFRRWLDPVEIAERFGARRADYERVRRWLVEHGFEVRRDSPFRISLVVAGTATQVEAALGAPIGLFRHRDRVYHAPLVEPAVPESLPVRGILGLDDLPALRPLVMLPPDTLGCLAGEPCSALAPADFAAAYGVDPLRAAGLTGAGSSIAVLARSNFADGDVAAFASRFVGVPLVPTRVFRDNDPRFDPGILRAESERIEVLLDTQWAGALAPGAALNVVIGSRQARQGSIFEALETAVVNRGLGLPNGDVISVSFGLCEPSATRIVTELLDAFYAVANAQGQTVLVASGDAGATDCLPDSRQIAVNGLASSSHAVAVGGTSFPLDAAGAVPAMLAETVWNDGFGAAGGGRSIVLAMPRFQVEAGLAPLSRGRVLPDLALAASPHAPGYAIVKDGQLQVVGGTSAAVPSFAGVLALVNEHLARTQGKTGGLGQLVPELYRLGSEQVRGLRAPVFRDITGGDNGGFAAGPGFDLATGWGAPRADALAAAVGAPGRCDLAIDALHPEAGCLVPSSRGSLGCAAEWLIEQDRFALRGGLPSVQQTCRDGDSQCDADGAADGSCTLRVALCLNVVDLRLLRGKGQNSRLRCRPRRVRRVRLLSPRASRRDPLAALNREALLTALGGLPDLPTNLANACTASAPVSVLAGGRLAVRARVSGSLGASVARVTLRCTP
jgi:hypothetical protein